MDESKLDPQKSKPPRKFNRIATATAVGMLIGIIMSFVTGKNDYAVILGTGIGAITGFVWDWLATRNGSSS
jgi:hypothetical protein